MKFIDDKMRLLFRDYVISEVKKELYESIEKRLQRKVIEHFVFMIGKLYT